MRPARPTPPVACRFRSDPLRTAESLGDGVAELTGYTAADFLSGRVHWVQLLGPDDRQRLGRALREAAAEDRPYQLEYRILRRDGTPRWVWEQGQGIRDGGCKPIAFAGFLTDITERRVSEERIARNEIRLRLALEAAELSAFEWDVERDEVRRYVSSGANLPPAPEAMPDTFEAARLAVHPDDRERFTARVHAALERADGYYENEFRLLRCDGRILWLHERGRVEHDAGGHPTRLIGFSQDITARKTAEQRLRESEEEFRAIFALSSVGKAQADPADGRFLRVNAALCRLFGYTEVELLQRTLLEVTHPDDRVAVGKLPEHRLRGEPACIEQEQRFVRQDGGIVWAQVTVNLIRDGEGKPTCMILIIQDISERKRVEAALRWRARRDELLSDMAACLLQSPDPRGLIDDLCRQVMDLLDCHVFFNYLLDQRTNRLCLNAWAGIDDEWAQGFRWLDRDAALCGCVAQEGRYHEPQDLPGPDDLRAALADSWGIQAHCCHPLQVQGRLIGTLSFGCRSRPRFGADDLEVMRAVTDLVGIALYRMQTEAALHESEERLAGIVNTALDAIVSVDETQRIRLFNPAAERIFGLRAAEALGQPLARLIPERYRAAHQRHMAHLQQGDWTARRMGGLREICGLRADGEEFPIDVSISHTTIGGVRIYTAILRDVTERHRAEQALRGSERRYRELVQYANSAIIRWSRDGTITFFNEYAQSFFGWTAEEVVGRHLGILLPERESTGVDLGRLLGNIVEQPERHANHVNENLCRDGRRVWMAWTNQVIRDEDGRVAEILSIGSDITERRRAEERLRVSEERFRNVFEHAATGIAITDLEGRFQQCNPAYCALVGYTQEELAQMDFIDLVHPEDRAGNLAASRRLLEGQLPFFEIENRYVRKDGQPIWVHKFVSLLRDGNGTPTHGVALITDVTQHHRLEQALREADRRKDEFLATLAHELRNPLAPLRNAVEILKRRGHADPIVQTARDLIDRQVQHMVRLIDDLLDVSRITRGRLQLRCEWVQLEAVLESALEAVRSQIRQAGQALAVDPAPGPVWLEADPVRLTQVFVNLLSNACKYTGPGGNIRVSVQRNGPEVLVAVRDTGMGIPAEHMPHLFEMFWQVGSGPDRSQGGLGIGLWLTRGLVELHRGRIEARSDGAGKGSEFTVYLPVPAAPPGLPAAEAKAADASPPPTGLRVLVADDNRDSADSLAVLLRFSGYQVWTAYDGATAIETAARERPHILLLDIGMPALDGYAVCRRIRTQPWGQNSTIIALTGWGMESDRRKSREAGFDAHLVKPVDATELLRLLAGA